MSIQAVAWVLESEHTTRQTDRLVLIALANHAGRNPHTGLHEAWPSLATIAREAGLRGTEPVRDAIVRLEAAGILERHVKAAPDARIPMDRRPNLYRFPGLERHLTTPHETGGRATTPHETGGPTPHGDGGPTPHGNDNDPLRRGGVTVSEPSIEPSVEPGAPSVPAVVEPKQLDPATLILRAWWERTTPRPAQPYVACLGVVRKMLMAGWSPQDVSWALDNAPVVSTGALTFALNQGKHRKKGGGAALQQALQAMEGMSEVEQLEWWNTHGPGRLSNG